VRRTYRWDPEQGQLVEVQKEVEHHYGTLIMPDIPDFVSPVDGRVVHGRRGLRDHNRELGVTNTADYTNEWKEKAAERAKFFYGDPSYDRKDRIEALKHAVDKHTRRK
jgi:hypothetical protein